MSRRFEARLMLGLAVVIAVALAVVPGGRWLLYPLLLLSSLAHELGHGVAALLVGGRFETLSLWTDGSGKAQYSAPVGRWRSAFVAAGGLVGPALAAAGAFALSRRLRWARPVLWATVGLLAMALVFVVRGVFARLFVALVTAVLAGLARWGARDTLQLALLFLGLQLGLSVFTQAGYLFTPTAVTAQGVFPSDVGQMAAALGGPYWFWGLVCGALSVGVLLFGLRDAWR